MLTEETLDALPIQGHFQTDSHERMMKIQKLQTCHSNFNYDR